MKYLFQIRKFSHTDFGSVIKSMRDPTPDDYFPLMNRWINKKTGKSFKLLKYYAIWEEEDERVD